MSKNFSASVARVLKWRGLSVNAAANEWNVPQKTLESIIKGDRIPKLDTAERIASKARFELWQMLHADFDPGNPPVLMPVTQQEREFHEKLRELMKSAPVSQ